MRIDTAHVVVGKVENRMLFHFEARGVMQRFSIVAESHGEGFIEYGLWSSAHGRRTVRAYDGIAVLVNESGVAFAQAEYIDGETADGDSRDVLGCMLVLVDMVEGSCDLPRQTV